jgi:hypothetical protein
MKAPLISLAGLSGTKGDRLEVSGGGMLQGATIGPIHYDEVFVVPRLIRRQTDFKQCRLDTWRVQLVLEDGVLDDQLLADGSTEQRTMCAAPVYSR